ncbi:phenylacetate--CoA ligase family protein [bacterium]|nr:phenylacetate--CoA ligase family protein [bacterium]
MNKTKLIDIISGKNISEYYELYKKTQWNSKEEMEEFQLNKLKKLVEHCYQNVPYYTEIMKNNDIRPSDINSIKDLEKFPILTKEIIKENYEKFYPLNQAKLKGVKTSQTGGTTGNILYKRNDAQTRSSVWGSYKRFYDWMGIGEKDRDFSYWGGHVLGHGLKQTLAEFVARKIKNSIFINAYDTRPETFSNIVSILNNQNIQLIRSYPQALYSLALKLKQKNYKFSIKAIMTTSEPLMPQHRELFKEVFGAESYDQYGCGEIGAIAYECNQHDGLHITEERVIVESNDKHELLLTDLDNYTMPYIRYWNADQATFSEQECSCGRKSRVIKQVLGRTCDYLNGINGETLHWAYFWHLLFDTEIATKRNFKKFQIVQKEPDYLLFRTVGDPLSNEDKVLLTSMVREKMGNMKIEYINEKDIENTKSGKYRPVINETL